MQGWSFVRNAAATVVVAAAVGAGLFAADSGGRDATVSAATAAPQANFTIYGDALASGWVDWSWDSAVNRGVTNPVCSGAKAIGWTVNAAWGGLYLHNGGGVSSAPFTSLTFALRATQPGQAVSVVLEDVRDHPLGAALALSSAYGGQPVAGAWTLYRICLLYTSPSPRDS